VGDKPVRVIVTRPAQDAAQWVDELTGHGLNALALPLIDIGPASDQAQVTALQDAWRNLNQYAACMFVSGNAVQYFFQYKRAASQSNRAQAAINNISFQAINTLPVNLRFLAPGPATAAALLAAGVPAGQIDSPPIDAGQFDSEALWQVVGQRDWRGARVLVLRGQTSAAPSPAAAGREWLAQQLRAAGAQVDMLSVYQRHAPHLTPQQQELAQTASSDGSIWLFSSSEALANLMQQPSLAAVDWRPSRAIATHPRIADAARGAGWGVVQESRPMLSDIIDALRQASLARI
jgi:uroporphyrinogen-III synthase